MRMRTSWTVATTWSLIVSWQLLLIACYSQLLFFTRRVSHGHSCSQQNWNNTQLWRHFGFQADEDGSIVMSKRLFVESVGWKCRTLAARHTWLRISFIVWLINHNTYIVQCMMTTWPLTPINIVIICWYIAILWSAMIINIEKMNIVAALYLTDILLLLPEFISCDLQGHALHFRSEASFLDSPTLSGCFWLWQGELLRMYKE